MTFVFCIIAAEAICYLIHRTLHSNIYPAWTQKHMIHHLEYYPPAARMRTEEYQTDSNEDRVKIGGIGLEWVSPAMILFVIFYFTTESLYIPIFMAVYAYIVFDYLHTSFHVKNHWLERFKYFRYIRKCHDKHHNDMTKNFGITGLLFDKIFKTYK